MPFSGRPTGERNAVQFTLQMFQSGYAGGGRLSAGRDCNLTVVAQYVALLCTTDGPRQSALRLEDSFYKKKKGYSVLL